MLELKIYQTEALEIFERWLEVLAEKEHESKEIVSAVMERGIDPDEQMTNFPRRAWEQIANQPDSWLPESSRSYVDRFDGTNRPIPHVCFKVPTGGGKTLLASTALERLNRQTGFVLWLVPTNTIFDQTKKMLWDREHPYRQILERASGGRVKMLLKDDEFTRADIEHYLCVMLVRLPAANRRRNKEFLKMFRDSGRYGTMFPDDDDVLGESTLIQKYRDLELNSGGSVKRSLFNVIKMLRPIVILDEAHKAYAKTSAKSSREFVGAVNRLNPSIVIELSATPNRGISNLLVDVQGTALHLEEMIKLPVQILSHSNTDWRTVLQLAVEEIERLSDEAIEVSSHQRTYIRPIAVIRVERTGDEQRTGQFIHAEDVRECLVTQLGVSSDAVRIQSSTTQELKGQDLLSPYSPVQWVITHSAVMEGWDCPFAYVLVILDNMRAQTALTQLVGRIIRQPYAKQTGNPRLDQCYIYCWNTEVERAVMSVKTGLEQAGLGDISDQVLWMQENDRQLEIIHRRPPFQGSEIYLPRVSHNAGDKWIELDYDRHILAEISWDEIAVTGMQVPYNEPRGLQRATVSLGDQPPVFHPEQTVEIDKSFKVSWYARRISDLVPNPWQAARIVEDAVQDLLTNAFSEAALYDRRGAVITELRMEISAKVDSQAKAIFDRKISNGQIRFDLESSQPTYKLYDKIEVDINPDDAIFTNGIKAIQASLFETVLDREFDSDLERRFARFLDGQRTIRWWHRVAATQRTGYYLRGWRRPRIFPDFIGLHDVNGGATTLLICETKGKHLSGNPDTDYKQEVLRVLQKAFVAGDFKLTTGPNAGRFTLIFSDEDFEHALPTEHPSAILDP